MVGLDSMGMNSMGMNLMGMDSMGMELVRMMKLARTRMPPTLRKPALAEEDGIDSGGVGGEACVISHQGLYRTHCSEKKRLMMAMILIMTLTSTGLLLNGGLGSGVGLMSRE